MPVFSMKSKGELATCHPDLRKVLYAAIKLVDFSVLEGTRDQATQDRYFKEGVSKLKFPDSKHNKVPSLAVDIAPWPTGFSDARYFYFIAGIIISIAWFYKKLGVISHELRWGGDWDSDLDFADQSFNDLGHFELVPLATEE